MKTLLRSSRRPLLWNSMFLVKVFVEDLIKVFVEFHQKVKVLNEDLNEDFNEDLFYGTALRTI